MKNFSNLLMALVLTVSSSISMAAKNDVSERLIRAELEMKRDMLKESIHNNLVQFSALEDETNDEDLLVYYHSKAKEFYLTLGVVSTGFAVGGVIAKLNEVVGYTSAVQSRLNSKVIYIAALAAAGFFFAAASQTDQPIYVETIEKLKSMNGEQKKKFAEEIFKSSNDSLAELKAIEAQLNAN